jgi:hypothetical protein
MNMIIFTVQDALGIVIGIVATVGHLIRNNMIFYGQVAQKGKKNSR